MKATNKFWITNHARERFLERSRRKYNRLSCNQAEDTKELWHDFMWEIKTKKREIDQEMIQRLSAAKENKSYLNNSMFMQRYYEKFGYDHRFQFLADQDLVYVIIIIDGEKKVVTCIKSKSHVAGRSSFKIKYKKAGRKNESRRMA